jgi:protein-tyrosine-phosphatase
MDLVVVMDAAQQQYLVRVFGVSPQRIIVAGDLDPVNCATRAIRDPWRKSVTVFEESFDRLDRCAATIAALTTSAGSPVPLNSSLSPAPARKAAV